MLRSLFSSFIAILICAPASSQESLTTLAKQIKPSVVTVISVANKKGIRRSGSGFFVARSRSLPMIPPDEMAAFAERVKSRFSGYRDVDDEDLVRRILERTPEYRVRVRFPYPFRDTAPNIFRVRKVGNGSRIVTNWHVVANSKSIEIRTQDKRSYSVLRIVAYSVEGDLALLETNASSQKYQPLQIADAFPEEGERVLVVGNPLGLLEGSLSDGIVSALRKTRRAGLVLQITAPVSPGSSGSPVVNCSGEVVGVVTSGLSMGQNLNFAVPWFTLARLLNPQDPLGLYGN
jgi:S1-C subfamily serine protease